LLGARRAAGFYLPGQFCPDPDLCVPYPASGLEVRRLLAPAAFLGAPDAREDLQVPPRHQDFRELPALAGADAVPPGASVCVHPGASVPERRWPPERFAAVADALARRGLRVVLTGTAAEAGLTQAVARSLRAPCLDLAGRTSLGAAAALLSRTRLLVSN